MQFLKLGPTLARTGLSAFLVALGYSQAVASAPPRPPLLAERLLLSDAQDEAQDGRLWAKVVAGMRLADVAVNQASDLGAECHYATALATLNELRQQKQDEAYIRTWVRNQERVLAACRDSGAEAPPPQRDAALGEPERAEGDYLYQLATWHFHRSAFREAMETYQQVEQLRTAPLRPLAAYMAVRCLAHLGDGNAAYARIERIEGDSSLASVHAITSNYRFVLMSPARAFEIEELSPELFVRHLQWLQSVVELDPEKALNKERARQTHADAMEQLRAYFPLFGPDGAVDWWLVDGPVPGPRMAAVKVLAPRNDMVAWMQAQWDLNVLEQDWLWALHMPRHNYWVQSQRLVQHHYKRWQESGNGTWLQLALSRVHPKDPLATQLLNQAAPYLSRPWSGETQEYREWLLQLWMHSVRVQLGRDKLAEAVALVEGHPELTRLFDSFRDNYRVSSRFRTNYHSVIEQSLRWLVYVGQYDAARRLLASQKLTPELQHWALVLAPDLEAALRAVRPSPMEAGSEAGRKVWWEWMNRMSAQALERIAKDDKLPLVERAMVSRTLVARHILRESDSATLNRVAALAAQLTPELREDLLAAMSGGERRRQLELLLQQPRFRPSVLIEYMPDRSGGPSTLAAIDSMNPNDNNWWCRYDGERFDKRLFDVFKFLPRPTALMSLNESSEELVEPLKLQRALLASHPLQHWVDESELRSLEAIPSGPEYLSRAINQWEREAPAAVSEDERGWRAANLHRAVRSTRYGCRRNGPHGSYSQESFRLLHERYADGPWAKATPYWFN